MASTFLGGGGGDAKPASTGNTGGGDASAANQTLQLNELQAINADLGAPADAAATSDTGTFAVFPFIKRGMINWTTLLSRIPALTANSRVAVESNVQLGSGVMTATTQRVTMATDGPTVGALSSIDTKTAAPRTPTTTSVASSATSVTILAANANRRGLSICNESTSTLRLSFSTPATAANSFMSIAGRASGLQPGFVMLDNQLIVTGAIYGIWDSANGTVQVTEYV